MTSKDSNPYIWTHYVLKQGAFFSIYRGLYFEYTDLVCTDILNEETHSMPVSVAVYFGDPVYE